MLNKKFKIALITSGIGAFATGASIIPVIITSSTKSSLSIKSAHADNVNHPMLNSYPNGLTYEELSKQFNNSKEGFVEIFKTIQKINTNIKVNFDNVEKFYDENTVKATKFIENANALLTHRGFFDGLWNEIIDLGNAIIGSVSTIFFTAIAGLTFGQVQELNDLASGSAEWTWDHATSFVKEFTGLDLNDFSNSDWGEFALTIVAMGASKLALPFAKETATWILGATTSKITSIAVTYGIKKLIGITAADFLKFTGQKFDKQISLADAKNNPDIPNAVKNNISIGDYYYSDGTTAYHFAIVDESVAAKKLQELNSDNYSKKWHDLSNGINNHIFTENDIDRSINVSEDGTTWHQDRIIHVENGKLVCSYSGSWSSDAVMWHDGYYHFSHSDISRQHDYGGVVKYLLIEDK